MSEIDTSEVVASDELTTLKARATLLGLTFHPSISLAKLREKINAAVSEGDAEEAGTSLPKLESLSDKRARKREEASELVRIRIACMNPAKKEWDGEIFAAGNSLVGTFTKYVPFNNEEGYHVPHIIYQQLLERQCQVFVSTRDNNGNSSRKGKLIKEFAIEILPKLTPSELTALAQRQAMAKSV